MVSPPQTYSIILHLEIKCLLHKSFIINNFGNSHSLQVNVIIILPRFLGSPQSKKISYIILIY